MDGSTHGLQANGTLEYIPPSATALKRVAKDMDIDKVLNWTNVEVALEQFHALVQFPPLRSVVINFSPDVCAVLLERTNVRNRPLLERYSQRFAESQRDLMFEFTGDTVKWSDTGALLDGQHRLDGARKAKKALKSHVVFGIPDKTFDVLDQGKKRSPADVLACEGVKNATIVASSIRQALIYTSQDRSAEVGYVAGGLSAREIVRHALGGMKSVQEFSGDGLLISKHFKHPPSMMTALLYMIGKHSKALSHEFADSWVHGGRAGRNKNFDVLNGRLMEIARVNNGNVNRQVRAALVIQTFNHWHSDVIARPQNLSWTRKMTFPTFEYNKAVFLKRKDKAENDNTALAASQNRLLVVLAKNTDKDGNVEMSVPKLADKASIKTNQVTYILTTMEAKQLVHKVRAKSPSGPAIWRLKDRGLERLRVISANGSTEA